MEEYRTKNPLLDPGEKPRDVHKPADVKELQELVKSANGSGEKLVPVSSAPVHEKGGTLCEEAHSIVDLSGWKKILRIDRRNRVSMIEPGVTYAELADALSSHGMTVSMPLAPRAGKSVLAAVLDREPSCWPNKQWDIADPLASMEVVFGDGSIFRTGAAGGPGSLEKQRASGGAQKGPTGPSQTDFQRLVGGSQGAVGIASWITVRCELMPSVEEPRLVGSDRLPLLADFIYATQKAGLGEHCFIIDRTSLSLLMGDEVSADLPHYLALINVCGFERLPEERVEYQLADLEDMVNDTGLKLSENVTGVIARSVMEKSVTPKGERAWRSAKTGNHLSIFFLSTLDRAEAFVDVFKKTARESGLASEEYGAYFQPVVQNHSCHIEFIVPFDGSEDKEIERMKGLEKKAVQELTKAGAFWSRPYGAAARLEAEREGTGRDLQRQVKEVFDPRRVLSPGRLGL